MKWPWILILVIAGSAVGAPGFDMRRDFTKVELGLLDSIQADSTCLAGSTSFQAVVVSNRSDATLVSGMDIGSSGAAPHVNIAYKLYKKDMRDPVSEGLRTLLPRPLESKEKTTVVVPVACPLVSGLYAVEIDLVQEGVAWRYLLKGANTQGRAILKLFVFEDSVDGLKARAEAMGWIFRPAPKLLGLTRDSQATIDRVYQLAQAELVTNVVSYAESGKRYKVFTAGSQYPMVWARDMATLQRGLASIGGIGRHEPPWGELFLRRFESEVGIPDWFELARMSENPASSGKNTVLSDQELWVISGLIDELDRGTLARSALHEGPVGAFATLSEALLVSLDWILKQRWDEKAGCLYTAHNADWGDVKLGGATNESATRYEPPRVCGLYSQALLFQVLSGLQRYGSELWTELPPTLLSLGGISNLRTAVQAFAERRLWQSSLGFYRVHVHLDPLGHSFNEDSMFALGGHVLALESGLVLPAHRDAIIRQFTAYTDRDHLGERAFGAVLVPSYPPHTFAHPDMDERYEYQNGGIWDWYAPRAAALIYRTDPIRGSQYLAAIARRIEGAQGFYEWFHVSGEPGNGKHYMASAAAFAWAVDSLRADTAQVPLDIYRRY